MCGIHGIVTDSLPREEIKKRLDQMGNLQRHRGPDDKRANLFSINGTVVGLGLVRLSILDLETGMQPIISQKDHSAIVCNGQIYNYIELKPEVADEIFISKGDIEVALHLYRVRGIEFLNHLNGMFAGAIYDPLNNRLILFRDRFGIKPLYYAEWKNNFFFASEIKPLLFGSHIPVKLNKSRLNAFFTYRYVPGEETMFHGIKRLPPGSYLDYDLVHKTYRIKRYWEYMLDRENPNLSLDDASAQFVELFENAVRIRLRSDVEVGSLLSGGIDSSAVSSVSARLKPDLKCFSISFEEEKYNEMPRIRRFLKMNGDRFRSVIHYARLCSVETLEHLPEIIRSVEEPISLGTILPTDQICELAGSQLKVVMTGEGADEIFAGYRKFLIETAAHRYKDFSREEQEQLNRTYPELVSYMAKRTKNPAMRYIQSESLYSAEELRVLTGLKAAGDVFPQEIRPRLSGNEHPLNAAIAFEARARLPDYVILRLDKLSMRHSLETRTPFLDYRLAEFAATLPIRFKVNLNANQGKYLCAYAYDQYSILDRETAFREKLPFTIPLADWLSTPSSLPPFLEEILHGDIIQKQGILNYDMVKGQVNKITTEGVGPQTLVSEADRVFAIVVFTLWYDIFFNRNLTGIEQA